MQIQRPNDKVTSLLIAESDNWLFSPSMQGKKSIHLVQVDGPPQQYCLILISLLFGLHTCNCQENKTGAPKAPCLWVLFISVLDEIPRTTSPNLKTIFYFSPSQKPHRAYGRTNEQTHGTYFLWWLSLNQGLKQRRCVRKPQIFMRNNSRVTAAGFQWFSNGAFSLILILEV